MLAIELSLYPLVVALNAIGNRILRLFGVERRSGSSEQYYTTEELQYIIQESHEGGLLRAESAGVLRELFEFQELDAGDVMVPRVRVKGIPHNASPELVVEILRKSRHTRYPVYSGDLDHIVGVVHVRDLLHCVIAGTSFAGEDVQGVAYLPETAPADVVLKTMHEEAMELVIVMDEHGGTAGIVVLEDLFEEVVGQIEESLAMEPEIFEDAEGHLHVAGTARLSDVGERLNRTLEHEDVDTVSGLVLMLLNRPPVPGDIVVVDGIQLVVTATEGHGVRECVVQGRDLGHDRTR
jgi:CBS domain containing-hemolysin-like protein